MTTEPKPDRWYTITVVEHVVHPRQRTDDSPPIVEVVQCTVRPNLAGSVLRATADEIDPKKPTMRGAGDSR